jgi:hypothetical protein
MVGIVCKLGYQCEKDSHPQLSADSDVSRFLVELFRYDWVGNEVLTWIVIRNYEIKNYH